MVEVACGNCKFWLIRKETKYGNGEIIVNWSSSEGKGHCRQLNIDTTSDFGCIKHKDGGPHIESVLKSGEPWHHKVMGPCPDCRYSYCGYPNCTYQFCPGTDKCMGRGMISDGSDRRCSGTGLVFYYDDGFIGENRTKLHPKEKELGVVIQDENDPTCPNCNSAVSPHWKICPECGHRLKDVDSNRISVMSGPL